jgi:16S rRNA (adenine1518-N6/adenine1519-N6)-dimethyltransferase
VNASRARKRFGQNFLTDPVVVGRIIELIGPGPDDHIVEIGPGRRALSDPLAARAGTLTLIEIDRDLGSSLCAHFGPQARVNVLVGDALSVDFTALATDRPLRVVGNLPYNISTPLILHLLQHARAITDMTFMLQKEVVDRLAAPAGTRDYGRLSVMVQSVCAVEACFEVAPEAFDPAPRVTSRLVRITPQTDPMPMGERAALEQCVRIAFGQRRKTLRNTLGKSYPADMLAECGIDVAERPADIAVNNYLQLARAIAKR